jgi:glutamate N-acetyltransferase/amino-acid N-acetyltransferase
MKIIQGGVTAPKGFKAAGIHAGIRKNKTKKDMALLVSDVPAHVAGAFTQNVVKASPVLWDKKLCEETGICQALVVNSGVANACTGDTGYENVVRTADCTGKQLGINPEMIAVSSTGVIGIQLPMDTIESGIRQMIGQLDNDMEAGTAAAEAIMTTDLYKKEIALTVDIKGTEVTIGGMCKGSGMINPNLGTVLGFITTDLNISTELLSKTLKNDVAYTYNMLSVDGDTSTNDTVMIFANGMAGNDELLETDEDYGTFVEALRYINIYFAKKIASDGEGTSRMFQVDVTGAADIEGARKLAKSVVTSNLVKCAVYGSDANWGRLVCAMGQSGVEFDPYKVDIYISSDAGRLQIVKDGVTTDYDEDMATEILSPSSVCFQADMNMGDESATAWGCDLTYDYIKINAEYRK